MHTMVAVALALSLAPSGAGQAAPAPSETPTQFYLRYRAMIPTASSIEQVMAMLSAEVVEAFKAAPPSERVGLDELKKGYGMIAGVRVVKESAAPNYATLTLEGSSPEKKSLTGMVELIRENGAWKVAGLEKWK